MHTAQEADAAHRANDFLLEQREDRARKEEERRLDAELRKLHTGAPAVGRPLALTPPSPAWFLTWDGCAQAAPWAEDPAILESMLAAAAEEVGDDGPVPLTDEQILELCKTVCH